MIPTQILLSKPPFFFVLEIFKVKTLLSTLWDVRLDCRMDIHMDKETWKSKYYIRFWKKHVIYFSRLQMRILFELGLYHYILKKRHVQIPKNWPSHMAGLLETEKNTDQEVPCKSEWNVLEIHFSILWRLSSICLQIWFSGSNSYFNKVGTFLCPCVCSKRIFGLLLDIIKCLQTWLNIIRVDF